jgi:hypothetical protein
MLRIIEDLIRTRDESETQAARDISDFATRIARGPELTAQELARLEELVRSRALSPDELNRRVEILQRFDALMAKAVQRRAEYLEAKQRADESASLLPSLQAELERLEGCIRAKDGRAMHSSAALQAAEQFALENHALLGTVNVRELVEQSVRKS